MLDPNQGGFELSSHVHISAGDWICYLKAELVLDLNLIKSLLFRLSDCIFEGMKLRR